MNDIDFLPESYRLAEARRTRIVREIVLLAAVAFCIAGWYANAQSRTADLERLAGALRDQATANQSQITQAIQFENQKQGILRQTRLQRGLIEPINISQIVAALGQLMPPSLAATSMTILDSRPAPSTSGAVSGDIPPSAPIHVEITGLAPTDMEIADFVGRLSSHPLFTNVKMDYSRAVQVRDLKAREFHVQFEVPLDREYKPIHGTREVARAD